MTLLSLPIHSDKVGGPAFGKDTLTGIVMSVETLGGLALGSSGRSCLTSTLTAFSSPAARCIALGSYVSPAWNLEGVPKPCIWEGCDCELATWKHVAWTCRHRVRANVGGSPLAHLRTLYGRCSVEWRRLAVQRVNRFSHLPFHFAGLNV